MSNEEHEEGVFDNPEIARVVGNIVRDVLQGFEGQKIDKTLIAKIEKKVRNERFPDDLKVMIPTSSYVRADIQHPYEVKCSGCGVVFTRAARRGTIKKVYCDDCAKSRRREQQRKWWRDNKGKKG